MLDGEKVGFGQLVQFLNAFAKKGFGPRQLTLFGQATPEQFEQMLEYLRGNRKMIPCQARWWKEGEQIIFPYKNEDRNGRELFMQDPGRFGVYVRMGAQEHGPSLQALKGAGQMVIVRGPESVTSFSDALKKLLELYPDLESVSPSAVLHFIQEDLRSFGCNRLVAMHKPLMSHGHAEVFVWRKESNGSMDLTTETVEPLPRATNHWGADRSAYLLKIKG